MELLSEGDNQLLCVSEKELGRDNKGSDNELPQNIDNEHLQATYRSFLLSLVFL